MGGLARWSSVRSNSCDWRARIERHPSSAANNSAMPISATYQLSTSQSSQEPDAGVAGAALAGSRSEEHTFELQSLAYLVCRLLLEKKKKKQKQNKHTKQQQQRHTATILKQ